MAPRTEAGETVATAYASIGQVDRAVEILRSMAKHGFIFTKGPVCPLTLGACEEPEFQACIREFGEAEKRLRVKYKSPPLESQALP